MWRICLRSPIISTYNQCSENECKNLIRHSNSSLLFISVSISHIFNFFLLLWFWLWSYPLHQTSMFDSILFYFNRNKNQISILCMQYPSFTRIWVRIDFYFIILEGKFFLSKDNGPFSPLTPSIMDFSLIFLTTISPISLTCRSDHCHHWTFTPQPLHFCHLAGGRVTVVH